MKQQEQKQSHFKKMKKKYIYIQYLCTNTVYKYRSTNTYTVFLVIQVSLVTESNIFKDPVELRAQVQALGLCKQ